MTPSLEPSVRLVKAREVERNIVDILAAAAPQTIGWLQVPLTPSRQAAIAAFETRHRTSILPHLLDALDDIIFDTGRQSSGADDHRPDERPAGGAERAGKGFNMPAACASSFGSAPKILGSSE